MQKIDGSSSLRGVGAPHVPLTGGTITLPRVSDTKAGAIKLCKNRSGYVQCHPTKQRCDSSFNPLALFR